MLARRYSGHTRRDQEGKDTMWVYQETKTEADALVPRLPEREPLPMKEAEQTSHTPEPPQKEIPRRKRFPGQPGLHPAGGGLSLWHADGRHPAGAV